MPEAVRTIVKSPPELWAEVSDPEALTKHLGAFGEIRITRLEPEATVAWEGDRASGTVALEPAGWGTKVTVVAEEEPSAEPEPEPEPVAEVEPEVEPAPEPEAEPQITPAAEVAVEVERVEAAAEVRRGFFARLFGRRGPATAVEVTPVDEPRPLMFAPEPVTVEITAVQPEPEPEPDPEPVAEPEPEPQAIGTVDAAAVLDGMLDSLGAAHHRPFSRG